MGKAENRVRSTKGEGQSNDEVMTPELIFGTIIKALGPIGLDPCSHPRSIVPSTTAILLPKYAPAIVQNAQRTFYSDGLRIVWRGHGLCFANPPYSEPLLSQFLAKGRDDGDEVVFLVPHRTGNRYWPLTAGTYDLKVELFRVKHHGETSNSPFHQVLLYRGPRLRQALGLGVLGDVHVHPRHTRLIDG